MCLAKVAQGANAMQLVTHNVGGSTGAGGQSVPARTFDWHTPSVHAHTYSLIMLLTLIDHIPKMSLMPDDAWCMCNGRITHTCPSSVINAGHDAWAAG